MTRCTDEDVLKIAENIKNEFQRRTFVTYIKECPSISTSFVVAAMLLQVDLSPADRGKLLQWRG